MKTSKAFLFITFSIILILTTSSFVLAYHDTLPSKQPTQVQNTSLNQGLAIVIFILLTALFLWYIYKTNNKK